MYTTRLLQNAYLFQSSIHFPPNDLNVIKYCILWKILHEVETSFNDTNIMRNSINYPFFRKESC